MVARALSILLLGVLLSASSWHRETPKTPQSPYLVLIVMDGFRPDYQTLAPMRHLRALMAQGMTYSNAWVGQMESETPTGHATIATGVYPRKHGVVGFGWRSTATGNFTFMPTDLRQISAGLLSRQIQAGGPTISDQIHARNPHDLIASMSDEKYYASASMGAGADYVLYGKYSKTGEHPVVIGPNIPPAAAYKHVSARDATPALQDQFSASLAIQIARTIRPRALLVNLPGADIAGHEFGGIRAPNDMAAIIRGDDYAIGRIVSAYKHLGLYKHTLFVVTADHGMASNGHIVPIHRMYATVAKTDPTSLDQEYRITLGSIWLRTPQHAAAVAGAMVAQHFPFIEGAMYRSPSGTSFALDPNTAAHMSRNLQQAYLDLANTEAGPTGPDVLLPYAEDTTGLVVKGSKKWGTHGGFSWGVQHIPLLLAGPGVRHGVSGFPAKLVDVAPTIERLMGLTIPSQVDGVVLNDALTQRTAREQAAQSDVQARRMADAQALRAHSLAQLKSRR